MATNAFKAYPIFKEDDNYVMWRKETELWKTFTDLSASKKVPAICLPLDGKACEGALELTADDLASENDVKLFTQLMTNLKHFGDPLT